MPRKRADFIEGFLEWTDDSESPRIYREWTALSVVASAMQRKCRLVWGSLVRFPNMYIVLVGPSGARKGTAMDPGYALLQNIGIRLSAEAVTREALIREINDALAMGKSISDDTGVQTHSSLTIYSQELTVFLGYGNLQLMADLSDWYDCGRGPAGVWKYQTKDKTLEDHVIGIWVNLIGATTPELIQSTLPRDAIGGGLTARIIFIYQPKRARAVVFPKVDSDIEVDLIHDLTDIFGMSGDFKVSEAFVDRYAEWYPTSETDISFKDERLSGYITRRGTHVMKMSMILSASRGSDMVLEREDIDRAIDMLERAEVQMPETFRGVGEEDTAGVMAKVMHTISIEGSITFSDLLKRHMHDATRDKLLAMIRSLREIKFCETSGNQKDGVIVTYIKEAEE